MIQSVFMHEIVSDKVIEEEILKDVLCSCCNINDSYFLLAQSRGIAIVLEHVCEPCYDAIGDIINSEKENIRVAILRKHVIEAVNR